MKPQINEQVEIDLYNFFIDRMNTLNNDIAWRCRAAELEPTDWKFIMMRGLLDCTATFMSKYINPDGDREILARFYELVLEARNKEEDE